MPHDGTLVGSPPLVAGKFSQALSFDGSTQYVDLGTLVDLTAVQTWTMECWLQTSTATGVHIAFSCTGTSQFWLGASGGHAQFNAGGASSITTTTNIADGLWHHVAVVVQANTTATIYVDGVQAGTGAISFTAGSADAFHLGFWSATANYWTGLIDEAAFSSSALYSGPFTPPSAPFSNTRSTQVALYHCDTADVLGATLRDANGLAGATILPNDPALLYSPFTWTVPTAGLVRTVNPGAYLRLRYANSAAVTLSFDLTNNTAPLPHIAYRFDGGPFQEAAIAASVALSAPPSRSQWRLLEVVFKSCVTTVDRFLTPVSALTLTGIGLDSGATWSAPPVRPHTVLLYGDSISEGAHSAANASADVTDNDVTLDYSFGLAEALDAELGVVAFAGEGVTGQANPGTNLPGFYSSSTSHCYDLLYSGVSRSFTSPAPDLVIYLLGQNDAGQGAGVQAGLEAIIAAIKAAAAQSKHLAFGDLKNTVASSVQAACAAAGATYSGALVNLLTYAVDSLDGSHPTGAAHQTKILPLVTEAARSVLGGSGGVLKISLGGGIGG